MDSFDTQGVTDDSALSPLELEAFYTKLKIIIWVIRVEVSFDTHPTEVSYATGLDDNDFSEAELFYQRPKWDLALLRVNIVGDWCSGKLATDGSILAGQTLFHIGHPSRFVGSFLTGRAAYRCLDVVVPSRAQTCGGPLFNDRGEIVGMVVLGLDGYDIAIHVAMLEHFMKEMENTRRDVILDDDKIGCSKRQKGEQHGYD
ncbi:hypothetical protein PHJA_001357600 [Phtheirospermum japonicum]|uniref:Uncharacterized protein n=1 Tax=Phtheirospermum japonicum TaxID=374723 RepID=A0A830CAI0_9LAMI|nr:hypothetical protein PHJA_001357600 [Phtheirospermum japonicum]